MSLDKSRLSREVEGSLDREDRKAVTGRRDTRMHSQVVSRKNIFSSSRWGKSYRYCSDFGWIMESWLDDG